MKPDGTHALTYRPDIDGLRAIAVLSVVVYHAFASLAPGGFVGVDIFFAISGYLITGILLRDLARERFSIAEFYGRRIRRLFPALIVVLVFTVVAAWWMLYSDEFRRTGKHLFTGAAFFANIAFWREQGYFDIASELKPLLHLWSLGVEEQFYFVWPLALFLLWKWRAGLFGIVTVLALLSFAWSVQLTSDAASDAFYLPHARFWELALGGLLAIWHHRTPLSAVTNRQRIAHLGSLLGAAMILYPVFALSAADPFPGLNALMPVAGAVILIGCGPYAWFNRHVLSNRAAIWVGLISYPLYLWHWPLLTFTRLSYDGHPPATMLALVAAMSVLLAFATFRFIEQPARRWYKASTTHPSGKAAVNIFKRARSPVVLLSAALALLAALGLAAYLGKLPPRLQLTTKAAQATTDWVAVKNANLPGQSDDIVLFIGDSYLQQYYPRLRRLSQLDQLQYNVVMRTQGGCAPIGGVERRKWSCLDNIDDAYERANAPGVKRIVLVGSWFGFTMRGDYFKPDDPTRSPIDVLDSSNDWIFSDFQAQIARWIDAGKDVVIVLTHPNSENADPKSLDSRLTLHPTLMAQPIDLKSFRARVEPMHERLRGISAATGARLIDPTDWLCRNDSCPSVENDGWPRYQDPSHFRAGYVADQITYLDALVQ